MRLASSTAVARDAVSGFAEIAPVSMRQRATIDPSTIEVMRNGVDAAHLLLKDLAELVSGLKNQADGVTVLASTIEQRDDQDSWTWSID